MARHNSIAIFVDDHYHFTPQRDETDTYKTEESYSDS